MLPSRRSIVKRFLAAPTLLTQDEAGAAIVVRPRDRKVLYVKNPDLAARAVLPPASTTKPFALFTLMATGKLKGDDLFQCPGHLQIEGHSLNCIHPRTPSPMNAARALAYSCNAAVAHFALRFSVDELPAALLRFGFTSPTGLLKISEASGWVRRETVGARCQLQALGESGIATTPLELLLAYLRLAEMLKQPRYAAILEGLEGAVKFGTAQAAQVSGVQVAGKTGSILLRNGSPAAWFAGFAPSHNPALAVVVLTPGRSGGSDAAPVAADLLRRYL